MTDIDIERIRKAAMTTGPFFGHTDECLYEHMECAVLALIERLEKAEKDALTWQDLAIKWRAMHGQTEYQRNKYGVALVMIEKGCADPAEFAGDILRRHPLTESKTDE